MPSLIRRHPLVSFFVLAFALTWWAVPFGGFLPIGPLAAALIVTGVTQGRAGLRALGRSMLPPRLRAGWYLVVVTIPIGLMAAALSINLALGAPVAALGRLDPWYVLLAIAAARLIDPLDGPLGEEPGWRGFALPRLLATRSPLGASLVLGVLVAAWHVPLVFLAGERLPPLFLVATVAVTFVYTWIYLRTNRSVFMTMLAHAAEGTIRIGALGLVGAASTRMTVLYTVAWCLLALALVLLDRKVWAAGPATAAAQAPGAPAQNLPRPVPVTV
jgi:membrane protease YdiL (CAAX protease family)